MVLVQAHPSTALLSFSPSKETNKEEQQPCIRFLCEPWREFCFSRGQFVVSVGR